MTSDMYYRLEALWNARPKQRKNHDVATISRERVWVERAAGMYRLIHYQTTLIEAYSSGGFLLQGHDSVATQQNLRKWAGLYTWRRNGAMMFGRVDISASPVLHDDDHRPVGDDFNVVVSPMAEDKLERLHTVLTDPAMPMAAGGQTIGECAPLIPLMPGFARPILRRVAAATGPDASMADYVSDVMRNALFGPYGAATAQSMPVTQFRQLAARFGVVVDNRAF